MTVGDAQNFVADIHPDFELRNLLDICTPIFQVVAEMDDNTMRESSNQIKVVVREIVDHGLSTPLTTFQTWQIARTQAQDRLQELRSDVRGVLNDLN